ncbi:HlyD family secretion protein [Coxiella endosymbiont of Amblyomma americanum]|uniref:HlyD family secretion protein n=1 Tax=Coxiella endosymbiont of Amblyomma americanum TaxID=325775 RepID=UPI00057F24B3|nr:HlyD family secretion protein [Coxiella endosymbiont of Amblyomma americanum]AJC50543.1 multidrug transporter [Coxiella endosymbiont of Amblyomma americanum]
MNRIIKIILALLVITTLTVVGYLYWKHEKRYPNTDDAYIQTNVINISPQVNGAITKVYVHNYQHVKKGQPLFDIDSTPFTIDFIKASAQLKDVMQKIKIMDTKIKLAKIVVLEKKSELVHAYAVFQRMLILSKRQFIPCVDSDLVMKKLDIARSALAAAKNQLQALVEKRNQIGNESPQLQLAKALLKKSQLNLSYTHVIAPSDGFIVNFNIHRGSNVNAYQSLFSLIEDNIWWTIANFKETQIEKIRPGQSATIRIDMYPNHIFLGYVESISAGSETSFSLLPPENTSGNWVKVTQRFPVKVIITGRHLNFPFRLGASSTVTIDTQSSPKS